MSPKRAIFFVCYTERVDRECFGNRPAGSVSFFFLNKRLRHGQQTRRWTENWILCSRMQAVVARQPATKGTSGCLWSGGQKTENHHSWLCVEVSRVRELICDWAPYDLLPCAKTLYLPTSSYCKMFHLPHLHLTRHKWISRLLYLPASGSRGCTSSQRLVECCWNQSVTVWVADNSTSHIEVIVWS